MPAGRSIGAFLEQVTPTGTPTETRSRPSPSSCSRIGSRSGAKTWCLLSSSSRSRTWSAGSSSDCSVVGSPAGSSVPASLGRSSAGSGFTVFLFCVPDDPPHLRARTRQHRHPGRGVHRRARCHTRPHRRFHHQRVLSARRPALRDRRHDRTGRHGPDRVRRGHHATVHQDIHARQYVPRHPERDDARAGRDQLLRRGRAYATRATGAGHLRERHSPCEKADPDRGPPGRRRHRGRPRHPASVPRATRRRRPATSTSSATTVSSRAPVLDRGAVQTAGDALEGPDERLGGPRGRRRRNRLPPLAPLLRRDERADGRRDGRTVAKYPGRFVADGPRRRRGGNTGW